MLAAESAATEKTVDHALLYRHYAAHIATQQQRTASDQVVISMREVAQVSQQAADASRKIAAAITELTRLADSLTVR